MLKMSPQKSKDTLKKFGEDVAYTFKGLYKTSDIIEILYNLSLIIPIVLGLVLIAFIIESNVSKIISIFALVLTLFPLIYQSHIKKISHYRILANKYKDVYDEIYLRYNKNNFEISDLQTRISELREQTSEYSINCLAKYWVDKKINKEMNLDWLK